MNFYFFIGACLLFLSPQTLKTKTNESVMNDSVLEVLGPRVWETRAWWPGGEPRVASLHLLSPAGWMTVGSPCPACGRGSGFLQLFPPWPGLRKQSDPPSPALVSAGTGGGRTSVPCLSHTGHTSSRTSDGLSRNCADLDPKSYLSCSASFQGKSEPHALDILRPIW